MNTLNRRGFAATKFPDECFDEFEHLLLEAVGKAVELGQDQLFHTFKICYKSRLFRLFEIGFSVSPLLLTLGLRANPVSEHVKVWYKVLSLTWC